MGIEFKDHGIKQLVHGSHRVSSVAETLQRIEPLLDHFQITRVANVTGLDCIGIPVTLAIRPNSKSVAVSQGKGITLEHAKASAIMESIEIWHAENFNKPVYYGCKYDLQRSWNIVQTDRLSEVPGNNFSEKTRTLWVRGIELFSSEEILVPYEMIHADYTRPVQPMHGYFPSSTNGLASGNSALEAVCHAIAEVIERDALSLWHFTPLPVKAANRINPASISSDECNNLVKMIEAAGLEYGLWNITSDAGIACIMCIIREGGNIAGHLGLGSGCHPDSSIALRRAITEAAQTRLNYISGSRDDLGLDEFEIKGIQAKYEFSDSLFANNNHPMQFAGIPSQTFSTLKEDFDHMMACLKQVGIGQICWVDLTQQEYDIPVARAIIPDLEAPHDDDNYVAGPRARKFRDK